MQKPIIRLTEKQYNKFSDHTKSILEIWESWGVLSVTRIVKGKDNKAYNKQIIMKKEGRKHESQNEN